MTLRPLTMSPLNWLTLIAVSILSGGSFYPKPSRTIAGGPTTI
jgi:hypothetical protein